MSLFNNTNAKYTKSQVLKFTSSLSLLRFPCRMSTKSLKQNFIGGMLAITIGLTVVPLRNTNFFE